MLFLSDFQDYPLYTCIQQVVLRKKMFECMLSTTIALPNGDTVVKTLFLTNDQKLFEVVNTVLGV